MYNKSILITGGTGTFGNKCVEILLKKYNPKKIVIFSRDEFKQFHMMKKFTSDKMRFFLGDVRDYERLSMALKDIDIVIHAAALKQVPQAETDPIECIKTNIIGTQNVISAAINSNKVKLVHAISTDKAANPINLYGSTKLCLEKVITAANNLTGTVKFSISRYGNVVGSRGSITTVFQDQLDKKLGYFTITDERMTRFWFNINKGVEFVLNNIQRTVGGELFIPKLKSVRITDLAKSFNPKYKLKFIGIRAGEKLHEYLITENEAENTIEYKDFFIIKPVINLNTTSKNLKIKTKSKINKYHDYLTTNLNEKGKLFKGHSYSSDKNIFFKISELKKYN
tara:strand:- start:1382 stop:2398 length:1017 start_codon:yes stop_codon:yes gene_type:complete